MKKLKPVKKLEIVRTELEHRSHYTYNYKPKSPVIYSQLSRGNHNIIENLNELSGVFFVMMKTESMTLSREFILF